MSENQRSSMNYDSHEGNSSVYSGDKQQEKNRHHYHQQWKSYEMRFIILKNELDELLVEQETVTKRKQKIQHG
jgi:hypothetical protein